MAGLLRFLLYFFAIYFLVRFVRQYIVPFFKNVDEINRRLKDQSRLRPSVRKPEKTARDEGEYIDFKEIK
ncbi:MAG: hypothetical protein NZM15_00085 [Flavobacteriales bacterium]|nr:hypothetical protein [Flavobacteriales bacterium]MDW8431084.1 hypothetical protein [Flavobacteriales bacterium]